MRSFAGILSVLKEKNFLMLEFKDYLSMYTELIIKANF
jgi:hypothetical protein